MKGIFYGIGVGPGDPELITFKAARLIESCPIIVCPSGAGEKQTALAIVAQAIPAMEEKEVIGLELPMTRDARRLVRYREAAVDQITQKLAQGMDVAFLTLGDPGIYSTFAYLHRLVEARGFETRIVPGVPSFCAAAACVGMSLGDEGESLHIIPGSYEGLREGLSLSGTKVIMKTGKAAGKLWDMLSEKGLLGRTAVVQRCGHKDEIIIPDLSHREKDGKAAEILDAYFSIFIVKETAQ